MKLKKLLAGLTAAALSVGLVAVTPMFTSAAENELLQDGALDSSGKYWDLATLEQYDSLIFNTTSSGTSDCGHTHDDETYCPWSGIGIMGVVETSDATIKEKDEYKDSNNRTWNSGVCYWYQSSAILKGGDTVDQSTGKGTSTVLVEDIINSIKNDENYDSSKYTVKGIKVSADSCWSCTCVSIYGVPKDTTVYEETELTISGVPTVADNSNIAIEIGKGKDLDISNCTEKASVKVYYTSGSASGYGNVQVIDNSTAWDTICSAFASKGEGVETYGMIPINFLTNVTKLVLQNNNGATITKVVLRDEKKDTVPVTSVTITGAPTTAMEIGETAELTATVAPDNATDKTVTWTSSNTEVATVVDGVVTAKKAGTATITATAGGVDSTPVTITVKAAIVPVTAAVTPDEVTVYSADKAAQAAEAEGKLTVSVTSADGKAIPSSNYTVTVDMASAAAEGAPAEAAVKVALTEAAKAAYSMTDFTKTVTVKYEDKVPAVYQGYDIKTALEIEADTEAEAVELIEALLKEQVLTLKGANGADDWTYGKVGANLKNISVGPLTDDNICTVTADIDMAAVRLPNDKYFSADSSITLGDSAEVSTKTESVTFTITVTLPDEPKPDEPKPDEPKPDEPKPDEPKPDEPKPDEPKPDEPKPDEPKPDEPKPDEPKPEDPKPDAPIASTPRIGEGVVATDINTGTAVTGTKALEAAASAKPGDRIDVVMTGNDNAGEVIAKIAGKKDVVVNLRYSGYIVSINSDDVADDFDAKNIYSAARFLTKSEKAAFAGAKELRQVRINSFNGIDKVTVSVIMRGGSKGEPATALNRVAAGKYQEVASGKVGEDRTFSFEVTKPGNYVVYTGDVSFED